LEAKPEAVVVKKNGRRKMHEPGRTTVISLILVLAPSLPAQQQAALETASAKPQPAASLSASRGGSSAPCSLPDVLGPASRRVRELVESLERIAATERIEHTRLTDDGRVTDRKLQVFDYVVDISEIRPGRLSVDEYRKLKSNNASSTPKLDSIGLAAAALIFHPFYLADFRMQCRGVAEHEGQIVYVIGFQQRTDRPNRFRTFVNRQGRFPIYFQGRALIAADTFQVLRIETQLLRPVPEVKLREENLAIDYAPVAFRSGQLQLWLPRAAEMVAHLRGSRYRLEHTFSDYELFSVEISGARPAQEKIKAEKP
jgi:hypothetical protein